MKAGTVDDQRRVILPETFPANSEVFIQQLDDDIVLIRLAKEGKKFKRVLIPVVDQIPADPEWDNVEESLGRAAYNALLKNPPPELAE